MKKLLTVGILATVSLFAFQTTADADQVDGSAVPEPATIGLMGAGLAAFGYAAWRRNRKR